VFYIKQICSQVLYPLPVTIALLVLGIVLLWFTSRKRTGKVVVTFGTLLLICTALPFLPGEMTHLLTGKIEPAWYLDHETSQLENENAEKPEWIVVLGVGYHNYEGVPYTLHAKPAFWSRVLEAVRLAKEFPNATILVSLPGNEPITSKRSFVEDIADLFSLSEERFDIIADARNTADEARLTARKIGKRSCLLVSGTTHLPRAMKLFEQEGMQPRPVPCTEIKSESSKFDLLAFFPSPYNVLQTRKVMHEWGGILFASITGRSDKEETE